MPTFLCEAIQIRKGVRRWNAQWRPPCADQASRTTLSMRTTCLPSGLGSSNVISSKHPAFAKLATKLDRAGQELVKIDGYLHSIKRADHPVNGWARTSALALGVHNIYNGIEDVML